MRPPPPLEQRPGRVPLARRTRSTRFTWGVALTALAFGTATKASADEPVREATHDPTAFPAPSTRLPLVGVGAATTLVWYGGALGGAYLFPTANGADELRIPIAGPWMSLAQTGCPSTTPNCGKFKLVLGAILKGFSGVGQAGGVLMMLEGLLLPTVQPQSSALRSVQTARRSETPNTSPHWMVAPTPMPEGMGVGVVGLF